MVEATIDLNVDCTNRNPDSNMMCCDAFCDFYMSVLNFDQKNGLHKP